MIYIICSSSKKAICLCNIINAYACKAIIDFKYSNIIMIPSMDQWSPSITLLICISGGYYPSIYNYYNILQRDQQIKFRNNLISKCNNEFKFLDNIKEIPRFSLIYQKNNTSIK